MILSTTKHYPLIHRTLIEWKALAQLGIPILIAQLAQMINGVVDTLVAGHASAKDLAGVGIGASIWLPVLIFFSGTLNALQPTISGHLGAKETQKIMPIAWQGLYIAAISSLLMILILTHLDFLLQLLQLDAQTTQIAKGYLSAFSWGVPALLLMIGLRGLTDGLGHTSTMMVFLLISTLLNAPLCYLFIFGVDLSHVSFLNLTLQIPAMGGIGAGWATALANWIAALLLLLYLHNSQRFREFTLLSNWTPPRWQAIKSLLHIGIPIGFTSFVEVSMFCMIALFLAPLGATTVAAHQIVLNTVSLFFMVPLSLGMALTLRVSYLLGAQHISQAKLLSRSALLLALSVACVNAPILFFCRDIIAMLYTNDNEVQKIAAQLFMLGAIFQIADVIQVTMISVLRGYKDTKIPMFIMLLSFWGICLPLGFVLTFKEWLHAPLGAAGFWTALIAGLSCAACLLTLRLFRIAEK